MRVVRLFSRSFIPFVSPVASGPEIGPASFYRVACEGPMVAPLLPMLEMLPLEAFPVDGPERRS